MTQDPGTVRRAGGALGARARFVAGAGHRSVMRIDALLGELQRRVEELEGRTAAAESRLQESIDRVTSIESSLARRLHDAEYLELADDVPLRHAAAAAWSAIAVAGEIRRLLSDTLPAPERFRLAVWSPWPPQASGVADHTQYLVQELVRHCDIDVFVEPPPATLVPSPAPRVRVLHYAAFDALDAAWPYDACLFCMGNSYFHSYSWGPLLRQAPTVVLAHELRFTNMYSDLAQRWHKPPLFFYDKVRELHPGPLPKTVCSPAKLRLDDDHLDKYHILMGKEVIACGDPLLVHSKYARQLAIDSDPATAERITIIPFGHPPLSPREHETRPAAEAVTVSTFGYVHESKQATKIAEAAAILHRADRRIAVRFVGEIVPAMHSDLRGVAAAAIGTTDRLDATTYNEEMARVDVAVQLRDYTHGENSGAIADCLAHGIPTIVSDLGAFREIPDDVAVRVPVDIAPSELADVVAALLGNAERRSALSKAGRAWAASHSFAVVADALWDHVKRASRPLVR